MSNAQFKISHIYKNIYISDIKYSYDIQELTNKNINAILYLGVKNKTEKVLDIYKNANIAHKFFKLTDTENSNISNLFEHTWAYINFHVNKNHNILIHCKQGVSRSPTIVAYYLVRKMHDRMKTKGYAESILDDVLELIQIYRPCSNPNKNFIKQLKNYEDNNIKNSQNVPT
jgi:protein tyrosine phosphatase